MIQHFTGKRIKFHSSKTSLEAFPLPSCATTMSGMFRCLQLSVLYTGSSSHTHIGKAAGKLETVLLCELFPAGHTVHCSVGFIDCGQTDGLWIKFTHREALLPGGTAPLGHCTVKIFEGFEKKEAVLTRRLGHWQWHLHWHWRSQHPKICLWQILKDHLFCPVLAI